MTKRILHILNSTSYSGAENVVITTIEGFRASDTDYEFIYASPDGSINGVLSKRGIIYAPMKSVCPSEVWRLIKKYNPTILHAHDFKASMVAAAAAGKIPVISHIHNNSPWLKKYCVYSLAYAVSCIKYKYILGVSDSVFSEYVFGKLIKNKAYVVGNPIDTSRVVAAATAADSKEAYDVCFLGRLCEPKDPLRFVELIKALNERVNATAVMMGDGPYRKAVEEKISKYGLSDKITVKGFVTNPYGILKNSKVLCAPSKWEGFGLMTVEALSLGVPVAASNVGGLPNILTPYCGALCRNDNEFIEFLYKLLTDAESYRDFCRGAVRRAEELNNITEYCKKIHSFYTM